MSNTVYKHINIAGASSEDVEDAIRGAISKASETINNIGWFEVSEICGHVAEGKMTNFQVGIKVGFRLE